MAFNPLVVGSNPTCTSERLGVPAFGAVAQWQSSVRVFEILVVTLFSEQRNTAPHPQTHIQFLGEL